MFDICFGIFASYVYDEIPNFPFKKYTVYYLNGKIIKKIDHPKMYTRALGWMKNPSILHSRMVLMLFSIFLMILNFFDFCVPTHALPQVSKYVFISNEIKMISKSPQIFDFALAVATFELLIPNVTRSTD